MIYLHRNALALVALADKEGNKHSLNCIHITECKDDWYRIEASNGKVLGILCGDGAAPTGPGLQGIDAQAVEDADNGRIEYLVDAKDFHACLKGLKEPQRMCVIGAEELITFIGGGMVSRRPFVEGRFAPVNNVLPKTQVVCQFGVNPNLLISILQAAAAVVDADNERVDLLWYGPGQPVGVMAKNGKGQTFDGLIMPLEPTRQEQDTPPAGGSHNNGVVK